PAADVIREGGQGLIDTVMGAALTRSVKGGLAPARAPKFKVDPEVTKYLARQVPEAAPEVAAQTVEAAPEAAAVSEAAPATKEAEPATTTSGPLESGESPVETPVEPGTVLDKVS